VTGDGPLSFEQSRTSFSLRGSRHMQVNFLATIHDEAAADAVAEVLARLGEVTGVRDAIDADQGRRLPGR